ncbi:MAG: SIS domain-containing protein [Chloroflexi bacterium]|nr:SIS domain-containing protein [Chloroflexota bacterium]
MNSVLHSEIFEQPQIAQNLLQLESVRIAAIAAALRARDPRYVLIAARGTSDNAARYAQYVFGIHNRLTTALAAPSIYSRFNATPRMDGALTIGVSQSGQSPDIVQVLIEARRQGAPTVAVTNDESSPLAQAAEFVIPLHAGAERSIAATKTYTAQLTALALLSAHLATDDKRLAALHTLPEALQRTLDAEEQAQTAATALRGASRCVVLGRGFQYATAFELALKIKELSYLLAEPYSTADFAHGPIAMLESDFPVLLLAAGPNGARLIVLGDEHNPPQDGEIAVPITAGLPEWLSPIAAILPGQLLAFHLAHARGFDPDLPRTIRKVTLTR